MSNKPATTTTTGTNTPTPGAQSTLFNNIWGDTNTAATRAVNQPVPQNTVAPLTAPQIQGANWFDTVAPSLGQNAGATGDLVNKIATGYFSNPNNDPNFAGAVQSFLDPTTRNLFTNVLPHVQDASLRASGGGTGPAAYGGTGGGSPQDILTRNVLNDWTRNVSNTVGGMAENRYNTGLGLIPQIGPLSASATSQALAPGQAFEAGGGILQGGNQGSLQDIINRYYMTGQGPLGFLSSAANIGAAGGFGNRTGTSTGPAPNMATQWLQGITGGAGAAGSLFGSGPGGSSSAFGNIASGIGNAATGATNWLSGLGLPSWAAAAAPDVAMMAA